MASDEQPTGAGGATTETAPAANGAARTDQQTRPQPAVPARPAGPSRGAATAQQPLRRRHRRPEMIAKKREQRYKQYEQRQRQWKYTKYSLIAIGLLVGAALVWFAVEQIQDQIERRNDDEALEEANVQEFAYEGGTHVEGDVAYTENPPVGGEHNAAWQNCGYYDAPVPEENAVHSMEHGAVWITYRPDLPADQIEDLKDRADSTTFLLVSPRPDNPAPVVLSSWNRQVQVQSIEDDAFDAFIREYRRHPDLPPEPTGICTGANSSTLPG